MGRFMNLAARVQAAASPGELLITEEMLTVLQGGNALEHQLTIGSSKPSPSKTLVNAGYFPFAKANPRIWCTSSVHSLYLQCLSYWLGIPDGSFYG